MWSIFGRKEKVPNLKAGRGFTAPVVGTANFQGSLLKVAGGRKTEDGANIDVTATLIPEPSNAFDKNAIAVFIGGAQVGYLAKEQAAIIAGFLSKQGLPKANCPARVVGGWLRDDGDEGHFGVKVSLSSSPKLAE